MSVELERNPKYFVDGRPYLDGVTLFIMPDQNSAYAAFRTGRLLMFRFLELGLGTRAEGELGEKVVIQRHSANSFRAFNMNTRRRPWDDIRVREAVSLAIDRRASIDVISDGEGAIGGCMSPSSSWALPTEELLNIPDYGPDVEANRKRARLLLAEAGFPNGLKTSMLTRKHAVSERLSVFLKDQLAKIGIEATLDVQESASAFDTLNRRGFDTAPWGTGFAVADPDAVFSEFYTCEAVRRFLRYKPLGAVGGVIILAMIAVALSAPLLAPYDPYELHVTKMFTPPGAEFWLGSDDYGRDLLSRLLYGARISLYVGLLAVGLGTTSGALIGLVSGYFGGKTDFVLQRLMDSLLAFPTLVLALAIVAALGQSTVNVEP